MGSTEPIFFSRNGRKRRDPLLTVETKAGKIQGKNLSDEIRAWLGIPYAEPPIGQYRFLPPRQPKSWNRLLFCFKCFDLTYFLLFVEKNSKHYS